MGCGSGFAGPQAQRPPRGGRELHEVNDSGGHYLTGRNCRKEAPARLCT